MKQVIEAVGMGMRRARSVVRQGLLVVVLTTVLPLVGGPEALAGVVPPARGSAQPRVQERPSTEDRWIVLLRDSAPSGAAVADEHRRRHGAEVSHVYESALKGYAARIERGRLGEIRSDPRVSFVHEDRVVEAVGTRETLVTGESAPTGVRRVDAATTTHAHHGATARVAVLDTGIDLDHGDLPSAIDGVNCIVPEAPAEDDLGHGTHVAGTIAAANKIRTDLRVSETNVVGVAPNTTVVAVKVLSAAGFGLWSQIICGIDWVTATRTKDNDPSNDVHVANMSLGGDAPPDTGNCEKEGPKKGEDAKDALHTAICKSTNAGITYVVAAGNDGENFAGIVPARYPEVLTVTAMSDSNGSGEKGSPPDCRRGEDDDRFASFSNYAVDTSEQNHAIAGPGVCITSTWVGGLYLTISGTSMATPHIAGIVALCLENLCKGMTPAQTIQRVRIDAKNHATLENGFEGDPLRPFSPGSKQKTRYFGYLAWAGAY